MFYSNPHVTVIYDYNLECIRTTWKGFVTGVNYRDAWEKSWELSLKENCNRWLYDQREQNMSDPNDTKWFIEELCPRVYEHMKDKVYIAILASKDAYERMVTSNALREISSGKFPGKAIIFEYFQNMTDAENWLKSHI